MRLLGSIFQEKGSSFTTNFRFWKVLSLAFTKEDSQRKGKTPNHSTLCILPYFTSAKGCTLCFKADTGGWRKISLIMVFKTKWKRRRDNLIMVHWPLEAAQSTLASGDSYKQFICFKVLLLKKRGEEGQGEREKEKKGKRTPKLLPPSFRFCMRPLNIALGIWGAGRCSIPA